MRPQDSHYVPLLIAAANQMVLDLSFCSLLFFSIFTGSSVEVQYLQVTEVYKYIKSDKIDKLSKPNIFWSRSFVAMIGITVWLGSIQAADLKKASSTALFEHRVVFHITRTKVLCSVELGPPALKWEV